MRFLLILGGLFVALGHATTTWATGAPEPVRPACPIVDPDSSVVTAIFEIPARDVVTIAPNGGETLASNGITIDALLRYAAGPAAGIPRQEIVVYNPALCLCPGGNIADVATDINGQTWFTSTIFGGGSCESLALYVDGVLVETLPIRINSPDLNADCAVDAADVCSFGARLGARVGHPNYTFAADFNEDGAIDAGDLSRLASTVGTRCSF